VHGKRLRQVTFSVPGPSVGTPRAQPLLKAVASDGEECKPSAGALEMHEFSVDFNARDEDGAVRLTRDDELRILDGHLVSLIKGAEVYITDEEIRAIGHLTKRDGIWVVVISQWLDDAP
jgi:hypothetical protein